MSVRRSLIVLLLLVLFLPFWAFNRTNQAAESATQVSLSDLQLYEVRRGDVALTVNAIGAIEAHNQVQLSFLTAGQVADIFVQRDDYVLAGDMLIRLENDNQRIAYEQALIGVEQAELQYEDILEVDDDQIRLAEAGVESARGGYLSTVSAVSAADLQTADLAYQQALEYAESLRIERDNIGGQYGGESTEYTTADARYGEATFQAEIARLQAQRLRTASAPQAAAASARITEAQRQLDQLLAGPTQLELDTAAISIEQAEEQLSRAEVAYNRTQLAAPFSGVITQLNTELGSLVAPGLAVIELTEIFPLGLTVQVDEIDITLVELNMPVRVELDAFPDLQFPATVTSIAPLGTPSGGIVSYAVEIALDSDDLRVRVGMTAEATIVIEETQDVLVVPNLYIRRERATGKTYVNVLHDDNTVEEVEVVMGIQGRENSEIVSGLEESALVAIDLSGRGLNILGGAE